MTNDNKKPDRDKKYSMEDLLNGIKTTFNEVEEKTPPTNDSLERQPHIIEHLKENRVANEPPKRQPHIIEYPKKNPVTNQSPKTKSIRSNSGGRGL